MAGQHREQMFGANSRFEAGQIKKYRESEADAAIQTGLDDIAQNYDNDEAIERIKQGMDEAVAFKVKGMGPEAVKNAYAELDDKIAMTRLARMLEDDPEKAAAWFKEHQKEFTADGLLKAEKSVNNALEIEKRKMEGEVAYHAFEDYWNKYHKDSMEAYNALYADSSLTVAQKDRIWSRMTAMTDKAEHDYITYWRDKIADSKSAEEAAELISQSGASGWKRAQMEGWAKQLHKPAAFKEKFGDWLAASQDIRTGKIKTEQELVDKYGGLLSVNSMKSFLRDIKTQNKPRTHTGFSEAEYKKDVQKKLGIDEGTPESALFMNFTNDALDRAEKEKGGELSELEISSVVDKCKKEYTSEGYGKLYPKVVLTRLKQQGWEEIGDGLLQNPDTGQTFDLSAYNPGGKSLKEQIADRTPPDPDDRRKEAPSFEGSPSRDGTPSPAETPDLN